MGSPLLSDPGGGGVSLGLGQGSATHPPTHPSTHQPTQPYPPTLPSTHSQSRNDQQKFTANGVGPQDLENRVQRYNQLSYRPVLTFLCNEGLRCLTQYEKNVKNV